MWGIKLFSFAFVISFCFQATSLGSEKQNDSAMLNILFKACMSEISDLSKKYEVIESVSKNEITGSSIVETVIVSFGYEKKEFYNIPGKWVETNQVIAKVIQDLYVAGSASAPKYECKVKSIDIKN